MIDFFRRVRVRGLGRLAAPVAMVAVLTAAIQAPAHARVAAEGPAGAGMAPASINYFDGSVHGARSNGSVSCTNDRLYVSGRLSDLQADGQTARVLIQFYSHLGGRNESVFAPDNGYTYYSFNSDHLRVTIYLAVGSGSWKEIYDGGGGQTYC